MVTLKKIGTVKRTAMLGNRLALEVLERYRRMGDPFFEGASLTYLDTTQVSQREIVNKHPIYMTLQLLSQKLYWEQNNSMIVNKHLYRSTVERQLAQTLEILRTEYRTLYPKFVKLHEKIHSLETARECTEMQILLSVQMKRLRGENDNLFSQEEQGLIQHLAQLDSGKKPDGSRLEEELRIIKHTEAEYDRHVISTDEIKEFKHTLRQEDKVQMQEEIRGEKGTDVTQEVKDIAEAGRISENERKDIPEIIEAFDVELFQDIERHIDLYSKTENVMEAVTLEKVQLPVIWKRYRDAVTEHYRVNQSMDMDEKLFVFLNTFQEGSSEEKIAFRTFLEEIKEEFVGQNRVEDIAVLLQNAPQELLLHLEEWQENTDRRILQRGRQQELQQEIQPELQQNILTTLEETVIESEHIRQLQETVMPGEVQPPVIWKKYWDAITENYSVEQSMDMDEKLFVFLNTFQEGTSEEKIAFRTFLEDIKEHFGGQNGAEDLTALLQNAPQELLFRLEEWQESTGKEILQKELQQEMQVPIPDLWKKYKEAIAVYSQTEKNFRTEEKMLIFRNTFREAEAEERIAFKTFLNRMNEHVTAQSTESSEASVMLQKKQQMFLERLEEQQEVINSLSKTEESSLLSAFRFFHSQAWEETVDNRLIYESEEIGKTLVNIEKQTSLETNRKRIRNTEEIRTGLLVYIKEVVNHGQTRLSKKQSVTEEHILRAQRRELLELYKTLMEQATEEERERLEHLIREEQRSENGQMREERLLVTGELRTFAVSGQEILEKPYSFVMRKQQLLNVINQGNTDQLMQLFTYVNTGQILNRRHMLVRNTQGIRSLLYQMVYRLTDDQVMNVAEQVTENMHRPVGMRYAEHAGSEVVRRPYAVSENVVGSVLEESEMIHKEKEVKEQENRQVEEVIRKHILVEREETSRLKKNQEMSVQLLSEQSEELRRIKTAMAEQSATMEEMQKKQTPEMDVNHLYREIMRRMERQLHLEQQRRGLD